MKPLERDLSQAASTSFLALALELDAGPVFIATRQALFPGERVIPAVHQFGTVSKDGCSLKIEAQALPPEADGAWWTNREAMILEVTPDMDSCYDGAIRFDGVVETEPTEENGILAISLIPARRKIVATPSYGIIEAGEWPQAAASVMGKVKPQIFGTVEGCDLLPVQVPVATTLSAAAAAQDAQLTVADATGLPASGTVVVDGHSYAYTSRTDTLLLGMAIQADHASGTAVVQSGPSVWLAAGHPVESITELRAGNALLPGGTVDLSASTVTFPSAQTVVASAVRNSLLMQFDEAATGNTASNPVNAIRAAVHQYTQSGTPTGAIVSSTANGGITFTRPADGLRIINGTYTVVFSVAVAAQVGWAKVTIGGDVVWYYQPITGVTYYTSPATVVFDDDTDLLPIKVEIDKNGSPDQVTVTVVSAQRVIYTGNLDDANYATVAPGQVLKVGQTSINPDRGPIASARLGVRWFATDATIGTTAVKFAGRTLGKLAITANSGTTLTRNITVDVVSQGQASLPQQNINTTISGGTASLSHQAVGRSVPITPPPILTQIDTTGIYSSYSECPSFDGWDAGLGNINLRSVYRATSLSEAQSAAINQSLYVDAPGGGWSTGGNDSWSTLVSGELYAVTRQINWAPTKLRFISIGIGNLLYLNAVAISWNGKITSGAVSQNNTPASGSSAPISAQNLSHSGTAVQVNGGNISFNVPAPPRVMESWFDLPNFTDWSQFTNQVAEISLSGTGASLCILQVVLAVEFDQVTRAVATDLTATVTGLPGNPADVLAALAQRSGERVDQPALRRLRAWCAARGYRFDRRLSEQTDTLTLMQYATDQALVVKAPGEDGLRFIRLRDTAQEIVTIRESDLLSAARLSWATAVENDITLRYRETGDGFTRVLTANAANNTLCRASVDRLKQTLSVTLEAGWIQDDATASAYLSDYVALRAPMRRVVALSLPFTYGGQLAMGALFEFRLVTYRVTDYSTDNGWVSLTGEQVL